VPIPVKFACYPDAKANFKDSQLRENLSSNTPKSNGHSTLAAFNIYANLESDSIFKAANAFDKYLAVQNTQSGQMSELIN
jgi:hypothetical protein